MHNLVNYDLRQALQRGEPYVDILDGYAPAVVASWPAPNVYGTVHVAGALYAALATTFPGIVRKFDATTGAVLADIVVGNDPRGLCFDGGYVWCANYDLGGVGPANTVSKIDTLSGTVVATIVTGDRPGFIEYDGAGSVWVACLGTTDAYKIDIATNAVTAVALGVQPRSLAFDNRLIVLPPRELR